MDGTQGLSLEQCKSHWDRPARQGGNCWSPRNHAKYSRTDLTLRVRGRASGAAAFRRPTYWGRVVPPMAALSGPPPKARGSAGGYLHHAEACRLLADLPRMQWTQTLSSVSEWQPVRPHDPQPAIPSQSASCTRWFRIEPS